MKQVSDLQIARIEEELKSMDTGEDFAPIIANINIAKKPTKKSKSRKRPAQVAAEKNEELKNKVSSMMSNHSQIVEDLKSKRSAKRQS